MTYFLTYPKLRVAALVLVFLATHVLWGQNNEEASEMSLIKTHEDKELVWGPCPPFMPEGCTIAVLHGDPAKANVDVFFKVPANYEIPPHWHTSAERMILVSGELHVTYEGEKEQIMKTGSYAYGPSEKPHKAKCGPKDPCVLFIAFEKPLDAFPMVVKE
ncbi:Cupin domain protein [Arenibacter nanhaiticus]|uniref:Cupin domain protein n=1 Tax=Arenibacter nanhaiticus TaxID=558155 RepID=A0A1M6G8B0_9FLAO|nr:cupin domain-containing protein [Arenibacter nanhaiticus]SHJ06213.1 Cupin domain protein [Arenibacter nanhaiticus]